MTDEPKLIDVELFRMDGITFDRRSVPEAAAAADPRDRRGIEMGRAILAAMAEGENKFRYLNLPRVRLPCADLTGISFSGSYLRLADFSGAYASGRSCRFEGAELFGAELTDMQGDFNFYKADLNGANLRGTNLAYAHLARTNIYRARVEGARFGDDVLKRHIASVDRSDGYTFHAFELEDGTVKIAAGCRWFTVDEYEAHIADNYPNTSLADETRAILDFLGTRARQTK